MDIDAINLEIKRILTKYNVELPIGIEAFWDTVVDMQEDVDRLSQLGLEWDRASRKK